jgi:hypothetical protein
MLISEDINIHSHCPQNLDLTLKLGYKQDLTGMYASDDETSCSITVCQLLIPL